MPKVRVYNLAKQLGITNKELLEELRSHGVEVKSHSSSLDDETVALFLEIRSEEKKPLPPVKEKPISKPQAKPPVEEKPISKPQVKSTVKEKPPPPPQVKSAVKEKPPPPPRPSRSKATAATVAVLLLPEVITIRELAEKLGQKTNVLQKKLMLMGYVTSCNQLLEGKIAQKVAQEFGIETEIIPLEDIEPAEGGEPSEMQPRPPVVTIMGHVDHGKTTLLDVIRETNVAQGEAGGITQHIGAYKVRLDKEGIKGEVVFLDTPGHEAFTAMRARGAKATDLVVLVVAADDGVMPQTIEAIDHARAAKVPIMVAVNKIDKPGANPERVRQELTKYELVPEEWGGHTIFADVSAKQRQGIENLLEMILLQAEMLELRAVAQKLAFGIIIEAKLDRGRGSVATVLVKSGILKVGDPFICGIFSGRVRALLNDIGNKISQAGPATPVEVVGFTGVPVAGDKFIVVSDERKAHQIAGNRQARSRRLELAHASKRITLEDLQRQIKEGKLKELKVIIKADVQGSVEALRDALLRLSTPEVSIKCLLTGAGGITETDVMLASASEAIIIGFNVRPGPKAKELAEHNGIDLRFYTVIYQVVADIKAASHGMLEPEYREVILGRAEVRELFHISRVGSVAGSYVTDGKVSRGGDCRLIRDNVVVYTGKILSMRRYKEDITSVRQGFECGIILENYQDIKQGDIVEIFTQEAIPRAIS